MYVHGPKSVLSHEDTYQTDVLEQQAGEQGYFVHRLYLIFSETKIPEKGLTPANGISPNFILPQKGLSDSNNRIIF